MRRARKQARGTCYDLGRHLLVVWREGDGWSVLVDGLGHEGRYPSEVAAWEAGVAAAHYLDGFVSATGRGA